MLSTLERELIHRVQQTETECSVRISLARNAVDRMFRRVNQMNNDGDIGNEQAEELRDMMRVLLNEHLKELS